MTNILVVVQYLYLFQHRGYGETASMNYWSRRTIAEGLYRMDQSMVVGSHVTKSHDLGCECVLLMMVLRCEIYCICFTGDLA